MLGMKTGLIGRLMLTLAIGAIAVTAAMGQAASPGAVTCPVGGYPLVSCPVMTDAVIAEVVRIRMAGLFDSPGSQVSIAVTNGVVVLTGQVEDEARKDAAGMIASSVRGVVSVRNDLTISPMGDQDLVILGRVLDTFRRYPLNTQQVRVSVVDGVVKLQGMVPDEYTRSMLEWIAYFVPGVTAVHNNLLVRFSGGAGGI